MAMSLLAQEGARPFVSSGGEYRKVCLPTSDGGQTGKGDMNGNIVEKKSTQFEFGHRQYQIDLIETAIRENVILCLPTGSGKTFIALKVTEHMLASCEGKKVIFLATSVPLVKQQTEFFKKHLPLSCGVISITGDMGVDFYSQNDWTKILAKHNVLVMSVVLLKTALNHQNLSWQDISLLILDECHNATGDHDMVKVMDLYKQCFHEGLSVPRVLGLTATVVKGGTARATVTKIQSEIDGIQNRLCCRAVTHPNFEEILKFSTSAKVNLVLLPPQLFSSDGIMCKDLHDVIKLMSMTQNPLENENVLLHHVGHPTLRSSHQVYNHKNTINENMTKIMTDVLDIYNELGPYCASIAALYKLPHIRKHIDEVKEKLGSRVVGHKAVLLLDIAHTSLHKFQKDIEKMMEVEYKRVKSQKRSECPSQKEFLLKTFKSEKIKEVLEILKRKSPALLKNSEEPLCGLLFCEKRFTTQILNWYFQDLPKHCSEYQFLKVDFILGCASKNLDIEESQSVSKRQSLVLEKFRRKELNLVIATAVLEEGLDVPSCNTIIRFNQIKNYPSYIQSMGRARMKNAKFYVLIPRDMHAEERKKFTTYDNFNRNLALTLAEKLESIVDDEPIIAQPGDSTIPTFCPGGTVNSPRLLETDVIPSVYRYCSLLKADGLSTPTPVSWCDKVAGGYKAYLILPSNSPVRDVIEGKLLGNKVLAKRSVFLKACELLYEAGELNENLLPRKEKKEDFENEFLKGLDEENNHRRQEGGPKLGTKKSTELYKQAVPFKMLSAPIRADTSIVLYKIDLSLEKHVSDNWAKINYSYDFKKHPYSFGLLMTNELILKDVPAFTLQVPAGLIKVTLTKQNKRVLLSKLQLDLVTRFQGFLAEIVHGLQVKGRLEEEKAELLVVAMEKNEIAWNKMEALDGFDLEMYCKPPPNKQSFRFDEKLYDDAVVIPWYRPLQTRQPNIFWVNEVSKKLTSSSYLQTKYGKTYAELFKNHWKKDLNPLLPLLICHAVGGQRNFLRCQGTPPNASASDGGTEFCLPPEVVNICPIPASFLLQGRYLMCILHRINRLISALLIQQSVGMKFDWNVTRKGADEENFSEDLKGKERKKPGDWTKTINKESSSSKFRTSENIKENGLDVAGMDYTDPRNLSWEHVEAFVKRQNLLKDSNRFTRNSNNNWEKRMVPNAVKPTSQWTEGLISVDLIKSNFDSKTDFRKVKGPNLFRIMEALTLANANDYVSLELLETKGDSVLKWTCSTHIFSNFPTWKEGRMTAVRTRLICNEHLCAVARKRKIGNHLAGSIFKKEEWIPPGFGEKKEKQIVLAINPEDDENGNKKKFKLMAPLGQYEISDKNIADSAEALIGAYYSDGGLDSALRLMEWLGLEGPCPGDENNKTSSSRPYSRHVSFKVPKHAFTSSSDTGDRKPSDLVPYLTELEKIISYNFKNKWLLVEALTHPTFLRNRFTQSYQRLEFLGDAVLDFLITCYIIDHTGIVSPGRVTDLRSALVNNVTFGCLSARYGFHRFMLHSSEKLHNKISAFAEFQHKQGHEVIDPYLLMSDEETALSENVDIPKALGDIFEAIAGAIYVDTDYSLDTLWKVVYRLMKPEIDAFSKEIPVNPVRKVMEMFPGKVETEDIDLGESGGDGQMCVEIRIQGTSYHARGVGTRKKLAKEAAAKQLLRTCHPPQKSSLDG